MKRIYIEPKNTVVRINLETLVAASPTGDIVVKPSETPIEDPNDFGGREVIRSRGAWEEW